MSPNTVFPPHEIPRNAITERVLEHPRVIYDVSEGVLVAAIRDELIVRRSVRQRVPELDKALSGIARQSAVLGREDGKRAAGDVEIWRLTEAEPNSIDEARRLRALAGDEDRNAAAARGPALPAVAPNHVCVLSPYDFCPASPPNPARSPRDADDFIRLPEGDGRARVVVIDSGYIAGDPPHSTLDERVTSLAGEWLDTSTDPATWRPDAPDVPDADGDGRLDGIAGHGTFIAGLIAHDCRQAEITVVGQRHEWLPVGSPPDPSDAAMLFMSEFDVANAVLTHADADVISCGFAFPTLDDYPSVPFAAVMEVLTGPEAPRQGVAVVAPAGNESSARPYWPAALPDVIGVAATNRRGNGRAFFSNWGPWADCCARGQDVFSTFINWYGPIEGEPLTDIEDFDGWARWDGTSFAAPKVSAAIAKLVAASGGALTPRAAFEELIGGASGVAVTPLTDAALSPLPVTLPHLHLG